MTASSGQLIVLVGPAGSGKTTLAHRLIAKDPLGRGFSVSHTTRAIRSNEIDGKDYHFIDRANFEHLIASGDFVEWATVHGNYYGTSRASIVEHVSAGRELFFDIDIQGAFHLFEQFSEQTRLVFIVPPSWQVLVSRLTARGTETTATLRRRLQTARKELEGLLNSALPWQIVVNDVLEEAIGDLDQATRTAKIELKHRALLEQMLQAAQADARAAS